MKRKLLLLLWPLLAGYSAQCQTLNIIDAIAGTLIPKITSSVREIWDPNKSKADQRQAKEQLESTIKLKTIEALKPFEVEANNIERVRQVFEVTRKLDELVGGLNIITDRFFLEAVKNSSDAAVKKQVARQFSVYWSQVQDYNSKLTALKADGIEVNLQNTLQSDIDNIQIYYSKMKAVIGVDAELKAVSQPGKENVVIAHMEMCEGYINDLQSAINNISRVVDVRLLAYQNSIKKAVAGN